MRENFPWPLKARVKPGNGHVRAAKVSSWTTSLDTTDRRPSFNPFSVVRADLLRLIILIG